MKLPMVVAYLHQCISLYKCRARVRASKCNRSGDDDDYRGRPNTSAVLLCAGQRAI